MVPVFPASVTVVVPPLHNGDAVAVAVPPTLTGFTVMVAYAVDGVFGALLIVQQTR